MRFFFEKKKRKFYHYDNIMHNVYEIKKNSKKKKGKERKKGKKDWYKPFMQATYV